MNKFFSICLFLFFTGNYIQAQIAIPGDFLQNLQSYAEGQGKVTITLDEGIEDNYYKHLTYNSNNPAVVGYKILIFRASGHDAKQRADEAKARFLSRYSEIGAVPSYDAPDYKVYVGDFRTRSEVDKFYDKIIKDFPFAFISINQPIDPEKYKSTVDHE